MIVYHKILKATFCITQNIGWDFPLAHYEGGKIPLNWYGLWNMSCFLRLHTPFPSNFKTLFSSRNRLRSVNDTIVLLADRCHAGHKNSNRLHAHGRACTIVAATQDLALSCIDVKGALLAEPYTGRPRRQQLRRRLIQEGLQWSEFTCDQPA